MNYRTHRLMRLLLFGPIGIALLLPLLLTVAWVYIAQPLRVSPAPGTTPGADPTLLEAHVRILSETFVPRTAYDVHHLAAAADYIRNQFVLAGAQTEEQVYEAYGATHRNVIGRFGPEEGARIIVGAHYDTFDGHPGADDNASGVAGLLELARLLATDTLPLRVDLVAFDLEEPPFFATPYMGSAVHAKTMHTNNVNVRAMIALEMIGYFQDERGSQRYPLPLLRLFYPSRGNFMAIIGDLDNRPLARTIKRGMRRATTLPVHSINAPRSIPGVDFSDHRNYWARGIPAVMVTDTAFYRNEAYHTENDTPDRLDYRRMGMAVDGVRGAVLALMKKE